MNVPIAAWINYHKKGRRHYNDEEEHIQRLPCHIERRKQIYELKEELDSCIQEQATLLHCEQEVKQKLILRPGNILQSSRVAEHLCLSTFKQSKSLFPGPP